MRKDIRKHQAVKGAAAAAADGTGGNEYPVIVAGIGVGSGGTKSLKQLLAKIPSGLGIAYVLVLHPGPSKKILSIRQLRNQASLEVVEATEGMPVLADRIHVMPSDRFLNITGSRLTLHKPVQCDGMWMPIDHFLCTLAHDFRRRSCGVVLSGAGSDGTLGLSEIKAFGGSAFVEAPGSAEFPEMPQGAIDAGVADAVLVAGAMAGAIAAMAEQAQEEMRRNQPSSGETHADLQDILNILRAKIGYDFSGYKPNTLVRRIRRRMALGRHASYADYAGFLNEHPDEVGLLQKDLLIGVTEFFRQPQAWEFLGEKVVAHVVENARSGSIIRVWVPGCSTGQEAYSLAMVLTEQVKKSGKKLGIQIFATDSDLSALSTARSGSYSKEEIGQTVSAERLKRFFERKDGRYQVLKQIREQIVFAPQNLTADPPFSRLDLISCRNLLMYLEQPVQQKIIVLFHFALREGGFLFLGTAESTGDREDLFDPVSKKWRIYRRIGIGRPAGIEIPVRPTGETIPSMGHIPVAPPVPRLTLASAAQQMLLDRFAPACVMIDRKLQVLYVHGKVEDYLTFPTGELTIRIVDMAREGLRARLRGAIGKCLEMKRPVSVIARVRRGEKSVPVKATVSPMRHPRETDGLLLVTFEDHRLPALKSGRGAARESDVQQLSDELKVTREELQSTIEQLESSNDQLKASNEEVTASNEELQSANEELETSKEELQSLNEELNTINARLQEKVGELEGTNNDVLNLLSSTAIATVFLDKELRVKRFTPASTRLLSLIPSDLGRPVADVLRRFEDEILLDDARRVLTELTPLAREVQADDGRWYFRRITPYRTQDDRIEGVVLTFVDVSDIKQAEQALRASEKKYRDLVESANSVIIRWRPDGEITYVNRYGLSFFGYREEEILGRNAMILVPGRDSSGQDLSGLTAAIVEHPEQYVSNENENVLADGRRVWVQWTNKAILDEAGNVREILAIGNDITERKRAEEELRLAHLRASWLARLPEENPNPVVRVSAEGEALYCNPAAAQLDGWKCEIGRPTPDPVLPLVRQAMAEGREVMQDVDLGERTYSVAVTSFPEEGYANVYGRDVTERKRAEAALGRNEAALRGILNATQESVWLFSPEGIVLMSNDMALQRFGMRAEEVIGRNFVEFVPAELSASRTARLREVAETGQPAEFEDERAGILFHHSFYPVIDSDGRVTGIASFSRDITDRKRAEHALRKSEERHRLLAETMLQGVVHQDSEGKIVSMNSAAERILGKTRQEFLGSSSVHEEHDTIREDGSAFPGLEHPSMVALRTGQPLRDVVMGVFNPRDNAYRWISIDAVPVFQSGKDKPHEVYTVFADITERKRAEEALRESETKYRNLFENMVEEVHFWKLVRDENGRIKTWRLVDANPPTLKTWGGKTVEEIRGKTTDEIFGDGATSHYMPIVQKIMNEGVPYSFEDYFTHLDKHFRFTSVPLGDYFITTGADITLIKKAEEALREARRRLEVIVDSIADGFYALDRQWRFTHVNDEALRHMGKTREEILGRTLFDVYPETRSSVIETEYALAMESGEPRHFENPSLVTGRILEIHAYPGSDNLTILFRDVTEQNRMVAALRESQEALRLANEYLEQRVRDRTMDLQNLAEQLEGSRHELRKLASELVMAEERERKRIAGVLHDDIAQILATVRIRLDMIHDIPPDHRDKQTLAEAKALLMQSIQETRALMTDIGNPLLFDMGLKPACESLAKRLMERHSIRIDCDIQDAYKHLDPDVKTILYQVVRELLNNVVKHSRAQNARVLIDMEDGQFRVKVTDDGAGFDPQTLGAPTAEGGFGLYSIRERLIAIEGRLRIESAPGAGTVVTAILPAAFD